MQGVAPFVASRLRRGRTDMKDSLALASNNTETILISRDVSTWSRSVRRS